MENKKSCSSYNLKNPVLTNRVFILQKSELEKRWDPSWYIYLQSIQRFKDEKVSFKNLLLENPQYGANEIGIERQTNTEPRYIRITDINEFGELEDVLGKTASIIEEKYFLQENDLLLARSGNTVGKSYLHKNVDYDCFFAGYMIRFKLDQSKVLPEYIFAYTQTRFYKNWTKAIQRTTGQPNINAEEYRNLEIPLPDKSTQSKIVKIYFDFIAQKQTNEAQAEKLLASIDDYLLNELGIKLPEPPENTLKNRMFTVSLNELSGSRFDPRYFQKHYLKFYENLDKLYPTKKIKDLSDYIGSGSTPRAGSDAYTDDETAGVPFIRITNLKNDTVLLDDVLFIKREIHENSLKRTQLKGGDILLSMAGTIGLTVIVPDFIIEANINQALARIVLKTGVNKVYIKEILNSKIGKTQTDRLSRPSVQANINFDEIGALLIPVPPIDKQKEIAEHITNIRQQAQQLKDNTKELLKKASEEIEEILLN